MSQVVNLMKIKIISIGKKIDKYLRIGIDEYSKRIEPYCNVALIELDDVGVKKDSEFEIENAKKIEGEKILKNIKNNDYVIALDLNKKELDSMQFSTFLIKTLEISGASITFVIGGSYGLSDEVKARANESISLSKMTFLHHMSRLILLEQIYRAFKIYNNEVYHK